MGALLLSRSIRGASGSNHKYRLRNPTSEDNNNNNTLDNNHTCKSNSRIWGPNDHTLRYNSHTWEVTRRTHHSRTPGDTSHTQADNNQHMYLHSNRMWEDSSSHTWQRSNRLARLAILFLIPPCLQLLPQLHRLGIPFHIPRFLEWLAPQVHCRCLSGYKKRIAMALPLPLHTHKP